MRKTIVIAMAAIGTALGCGLFEVEVIQPQTHCIGYAGANYWGKVEPAQVTACTDGTIKTKLEF